MTTIHEVKAYCRELSPADVERAIKFNEMARDEAIISYDLFFEQNKLPRKIFIEGYNAMYAASALFLAKKYKTKLDEARGATHRNMRIVLEFYTQDSEHHYKLLKLYEIAVDQFISISQQYRNEKHFADKVVKDLMSEGFHQGKKVNYYSDPNPSRKDPLELNIEDSKKFINEIVKPFLFIMEKLTND